MKIENIKQLQALIKLCRTTGVEAIEVDGIKMNLGAAPTVIYKQHKTSTKSAEEIIETIAPGGITEEVKIPTNGLTEEQLLFYSAQGHEPVEQQ